MKLMAKNGMADEKDEYLRSLFPCGIGFKIKILDALSVVNVRRVRLPPSSLPKIFILKPIVFVSFFSCPVVGQ